MKKLSRDLVSRATTWTNIYTMESTVVTVSGLSKTTAVIEKIPIRNSILGQSFVAKVVHTAKTALAVWITNPIYGMGDKASTAPG